MSMETNYSRHIFIVFFIVTLLLSFLIVQPMIPILLWSAVLSFIFYPVHRWINTKINMPSLSAFITILLMILFVTIPFVFVLQSVSNEVFGLYGFAREHLQNGNLDLDSLDAQCIDNPDLKCRAYDWYGRAARSLNLDNEQALNDLLKPVLNFAGGVALGIPSTVFRIAIAFFITFFLLRDGKSFIRKTFYYLPLKKSDSEVIIQQLHKATYSIVFASLLVALIQGMLGSLGFWFAGFDSPIILGLVMAFFALIPMVGTAIVWGPASLYLIGKGIFNGMTSEIWWGVGLLVYGLFVISTLDNFLRPKIAGDVSKIHPLVVVIGVIGGTSLWGFIGIFVGPVALALLITFIKLSKEKFQPKIRTRMKG